MKLRVSSSGGSWRRFGASRRHFIFLAFLLGTIAGCGNSDIGVKSEAVATSTSERHGQRGLEITFKEPVDTFARNSYIDRFFVTTPGREGRDLISRISLLLNGQPLQILFGTLATEDDIETVRSIALDPTMVESIRVVR